MIPPLDPATGFLPCGRFPSSEAEIFDRFVNAEEFSNSTTRREIWEHWKAARTFVQDRLKLYAVWFAGSFLTAKPDPGDLDVALIWDAEEYDALDPDRQQEVTLFALGSQGAQLHGLMIDSYAIPWRSHPFVTPQALHLDDYFRRRGYWDDWWMRARTGGKEDPPTAEDAVPRRGYLEVNFHEYC